MEKMNGKIGPRSKAAVNLDSSLFNKVLETRKKHTVCKGFAEEDIPDIRYFIAASALSTLSHSEKGREEKWGILVYFKQIDFKYSK